MIFALHYPGPHFSAKRPRPVMAGGSKCRCWQCCWIATGASWPMSARAQSGLHVGPEVPWAAGVSGIRASCECAARGPALKAGRPETSGAAQTAVPSAFSAAERCWPPPRIPDASGHLHAFQDEQHVLAVEPLAHQADAKTLPRERPKPPAISMPRSSSRNFRTLASSTPPAPTAC